MSGRLGVLGLCLLAGCGWTRSAARAAEAPVRAVSSESALIEATEPSGIAREHWPLSVGCPFPPGVLPDPTRLALVDGTAVLPVQTRVLSRWADGSARWVLLDWQADLAPHQTRRFRVTQVAAAPPARVVGVREEADRLSIDTGAMRFTIPRTRLAIAADMTVGGHAVLSAPVRPYFVIRGQRVEAEAPRSVTVIDRGALRVRVELRGRYASRFEYVIRIDAFAGQPFLRVLHSFEQHSPEEVTLADQLAVEFPLTAGSGRRDLVGDDQGRAVALPPTETSAVLVQDDNEAYRLNGKRYLGHAAGWAQVSGGNGGVAVAARYFWQEYPQAFEFTPGGLLYDLWAPHDGPARIGMGSAKTHEFVIYAFAGGQPAPPRVAAAVHPLPVGVAPQWIAASGALRNSVALEPATAGFFEQLHAAFRRVEANADGERWDDSGSVQCPPPERERPRRGFYGMLNWGDWNYPGYHDTTKGCDAWGNLEYDLTQVLALAYAGSGRAEYFDAMVPAARHFADVDRIYFQAEHPNWIGMNHPKNPLHFSFALGGVDLGHTWTEGLLSYYAFTGDERALEAARGIADYLVRRLAAGRLRGNPRQWGWPQIALIAVYEMTGDAHYRQAALAYARGGMAAHPPDQVADFKMGVLAEGLAYTDSVMHDAGIRQWLARHVAAVVARGGTVDRRFTPAVAYVGRADRRPEYAAAAGATLARLKFGSWAKPFTITGRVGFSILATQADASDGAHKARASAKPK